MGCAAEVSYPSASFFVAAVSGPGCGRCALRTNTITGPTCTSLSCAADCRESGDINNDLFGCGTLGTTAVTGPCDGLNRSSGDNCGALPGPWACGGASMESRTVTKPAVGGGGVLCCRDPGSLVCPTGQVACSGVCANTQTDPAHCGACGRACPTGQICSAGSCAAAPTVSTPMGSATRVVGSTVGGTPFNDRCGAGSAMTGFEAGVSGSFNVMRLLCRPLVLSYPGGVPTVTTGPTVRLTFRGTPSGMLGTSSCPDHQVVVGMTGNAGSLVDRVALRCAPIVAMGSGAALTFSFGATTRSPPVGGTGGSSCGDVDCPTGQFAGGALIRAGGNVDGLGLLCNRLAVTP